MWNEDNQIIDRHFARIPNGTSNNAEYEAFLVGLNRAHNQGITHLTVRCDSKVMTDHFNHQNNVTNENLVNKMDRIRDAAKKFEYIHAHHVYREENREADRVANMAFRQEVDSLD